MSVSDVLITHEPVLNRQKAITANRLLVHAPNSEAAMEALCAIGDAWPIARTVFLGLAGCRPDAALASWQVPENALIEIPASDIADPDSVDLMQSLAKAGVPLCLSGYAEGGIAAPAGTNFRFVLADAKLAPTAVRVPGILIAQNLADLAAFDSALAAGYGGGVGWFFKRGQPPSKKLQSAHAQIVRVLNLVRRGAEVREVENALKQDVALSFRLLRYINSAGFGLRCEVQSFRHAVTILGYDKLNKWLSLLLVTASKDPTAPALMQAAITRGRFMELMGAAYFEREEFDNLFITGAFSLLDRLLGSTMATVLEGMTLPEPICDALLGRGGPYTALLELARACEADNRSALQAALGGLQADPLAVNRNQLLALQFADTLQFH
ncbi:MAG: HDOD domain-containing protein [Rhodocyclaceae bacterium]|nr:HDOD domain-containing protein [Rhodocyclaceae bacterium]MBX3668796.1 HDOD domain-containing protein [Rhodocyclaceae bacterium]